MSENLEHCQLCDEPTGHAGAGEDSIFIDTNGHRIGPLCHPCLDGIRQWVLRDCGYDIGQVEKLINAPAGLSDQIEALKATVAKKDSENVALRTEITALAAERDRLCHTLSRVLDQFTEAGHPGEPCLRTPWQYVRTVEEWKRALVPHPPTGETQSQYMVICWDCGAKAIAGALTTCHHCGKGNLAIRPLSETQATELLGQTRTELRGAER